jgi:4-hydroxy-2-oxoheptanedioate aldolase
MLEIIAKFKESLRSPQGVFGPFMITSDPAVVEAAGYAGYDFAILDMEHGPSGYENMQNLIRAAQVSRLMPIVRVSRGSDIWIDRALDIGAGGVLVPQVDNAGQARQVIDAAKFSPGGNRGVCRYVRAARYSATPAADYFRDANETVVILQAEGKKALDNLDEILAVKGFDILFIGPYDLSSSLGYIGQVDHPVVQQCVRDITRKAAEKHITVGTFADSVERAIYWRDQGIRFLSYSCDVGIFYQAAKKDADLFKKP